MVKSAIQYWEFKGKKVKSTWIDDEEFFNYAPVTQVYAVVVNTKGQVLICRKSEKYAWNLPGGHPEKGESWEETLKRELLEEVDVSVKLIKPLGLQKVEYVESSVADEYQARAMAILDKLLPQTPEPDSGLIFERKLVPFKEITDYIQWGEIGVVLFNKARGYFEKLKQTI